MEGSGAGSILVTNESGCGSGRLNNIQIPNTDHNYKYSNPVPRSSVLYINDMSKGNGENPHSVDADTELCWCWIRIRIQAFEDQDLIKIQDDILTMRKLATPPKHAYKFWKIFYFSRHFLGTFGSVSMHWTEKNLISADSYPKHCAAMLMRQNLSAAFRPYLLYYLHVGSLEFFDKKHKLSLIKTLGARKQQAVNRSDLFPGSPWIELISVFLTGLRIRIRSEELFCRSKIWIWSFSNLDSKRKPQYGKTQTFD